MEQLAGYEPYMAMLADSQRQQTQYCVSDAVGVGCVVVVVVEVCLGWGHIVKCESAECLCGVWLGCCLSGADKCFCACECECELC